MNTQYDYADNEVKGLERYLPTGLSKTLACLIIPSFLSTFWVILSYADKLVPSWNPNEQKLLALFAASASALVISLALIIDLIVIIYQSKHRRITHHCYANQHMSFKWLKNNATIKHWLFLVLIFSVGVGCGALLYQYL